LQSREQGLIFIFCVCPLLSSEIKIVAAVGPVHIAAIAVAVDREDDASAADGGVEYQIRLSFGLARPDGAKEGRHFYSHYIHLP